MLFRGTAIVVKFLNFKKLMLYVSPRRKINVTRPDDLALAAFYLGTANDEY